MLEAVKSTGSSTTLLKETLYTEGDSPKAKLKRQSFANLLQESKDVEEKKEKAKIARKNKLKEKKVKEAEEKALDDIAEKIFNGGDQ